MVQCDSCCNSDNVLQTKCKHAICRKCFENYINSLKRYPIPCFHCNLAISDEECEKILGHSLPKALKNHFLSMTNPNLIQCFNPDCSWLYDTKGQQITEFACEDCNKKTCLKCNAFHNFDETCDNWKENNEDVLQSRKKIEDDMKLKGNSGIGVKCGVCHIFLEKIEGCDIIKCPSCSTLLCFRTGKKRWGPRGHGDNSEGCRCLFDGKTRCHPQCRGCNNYHGY